MTEKDVIALDSAALNYIAGRRDRIQTGLDVYLAFKAGADWAFHESVSRAARTKSEAKSAAARENGKKGGRPRKNTNQMGNNNE